MAELSVKLFSADGNPVSETEVVSLEWSRDEAAPCDALKLQLTAEKPLPELDRIWLLRDGEMVFSGFCDSQREVTESGGVRVYVYARSVACALVDNEAVPGTFRQVTADTLFLLYAGALGFRSKLPRLVCSSDYVVNKGTSLYGAVNAFVQAMTGKNICVSPQKVLYLPDDADVTVLPADTLLQEERQIRRAGALSRIDFKTQEDDGYNHHYLSRTMEEKGIVRTRKVNMAALPYWQQNASVQGQLQKAADGCYSAVLTVSGCPQAELGGSVRCAALQNDLTGYRIISFTVRADKSGVRTQIRLKKPLNLRGITYVA